MNQEIKGGDLNDFLLQLKKKKKPGNTAFRKYLTRTCKCSVKRI